MRVFTKADLAEDVCGLVQGDKILKMAFLNAHLGNCAISNADLSKALHDFLIVNDGLGVDIASLILYRQPFPENLNGTDFIPYLLDHCEQSLRIFLLGAKPEVVPLAAKTVRNRWPGHRVVGFQHGFYPADEEAAIGRRIASLRPDLVLVAMGNPKQELWIAENVPQVCRRAIAVGALFDFLAGRTQRAPLLVRQARCEWIYRLLLEPRRMWRRYLVGNWRFVLRACADAARRRWASRDGVTRTSVVGRSGSEL